MFFTKCLCLFINIRVLIYNYVVTPSIPNLYVSLKHCRFIEKSWGIFIILLYSLICLDIENGLLFLFFVVLCALT